MGSPVFKFMTLCVIISVLIAYWGNTLKPTDVQNIITFTAIDFGFLMTSLTFSDIRSYVDKISDTEKERVQLVGQIASMFKFTGNLSLLLIFSCLLFCCFGFDSCVEGDLRAQIFSAFLVFLFVYVLCSVFLLFRRIVRIVFSTKLFNK